MNTLIVDDETDLLDEIEFYVKKYGSMGSIVVCSNAFAALEQAAKTSFDLALLDVEMPGMNGLELAERLASRYPQMGIVFLTAYNHYATEAFEVNALDYVLKPIREERIYKALDKFRTRRHDTLQAVVGSSQLSIQMFDKFILRKGGELLDWNRQKSRELFAYLLENKGFPVHKEKLCELLWPGLEPKKALVNLQTAVYSIRKMLETDADSPVSIKYAGNHYILYIRGCLTDVDRFESLVQKASDLNDTALFKQAVSLHTGGYLEEEGWLWAEPKKELLWKKYQAAMQRLKGKKGALKMAHIL